MKKINMLVNAADRQSVIRPEIYGHFSEHLGRCIYEGMYVGSDSPIPNKDGVRTDIIDAFKEIKMPVLRWPGGCFADEYHWKDGIGEKSCRKKMVNTNWGHVTEDNSFGTHEFFNLCEEIGCEPYLAGNLGSGTVQELAEWIEYITFDGMSPMAEMRRKNGREKPWKLKFLGIGNESWGCGGNMRPEYYADEYLRYQSFCKNFSGNQLFKVACGPNADDLHWTEELMKRLNKWNANAISLHYYTIPSGNWQHKGDAVEFNESEYYSTISATLQMERIIDGHCNIMDRYDPENSIGLIVDEWGCWYDVEKGTNPGFLYQQNTMRDAIVAAVNLNLFNRKSRRVVMANLAQAVNVLQALILTDGATMIKTPTYHVFDLFKSHQGGRLIYCQSDNVTDGCGDISIPMISSSASVNDGTVTLTIANCSLKEDAEITADIKGITVKNACCRILASGDVHDHNTAENTELVKPADGSISAAGETIKVTVPACSVLCIIIS